MTHRIRKWSDSVAIVTFNLIISRPFRRVYSTVTAVLLGIRVYSTVTAVLGIRVYNTVTAVSLGIRVYSTVTAVLL